MLIEINTTSQSPIYEQLRDQIVLGMAAGQLTPGEKLPSVRRLGVDIGINYHTVNKAYTMLCEEGYIVLDTRKRAAVSPMMKCTGDFQARLSQKLLLIAAEAICHGISKEEFTKTCSKYYQKAMEGQTNGH